MPHDDNISPVPPPMVMGSGNARLEPILRRNQMGSRSRFPSHPSPKEHQGGDQKPFAYKASDCADARFADQAIFGAPPKLIAEIRTKGFEPWLDKQLAHSVVDRQHSRGQPLQWRPIRPPCMAECANKASTDVGCGLRTVMRAIRQQCLCTRDFRTAQVQEVIEHGHNGLLVDFFDHQALADTLADALERRAELQALPEAARQTVVAAP